MSVKPTPEEMERYYSDRSNEVVEGETEEQWQDFYARCCSHHHAEARRDRARVERNRRKRARSSRA